MYAKGNKIFYFHSFGVEHVPKEVEKFIGHENIKANIFRVHTNNSTMWGCFCIEFIDFMFAGKTLIGFAGLFSPDDF